MTMRICSLIIACLALSGTAVLGRDSSRIRDLLVK